MQITSPPAPLTDNLWMLGSAAYPLYLFQDGNEAAIVEGGTGAMGPLLAQQLDDLGIAPETVNQVIVTHAHPDHVMAVPKFREMFPGVSVSASQAAAGTLSIEKALAFFGKMDQALTGALLNAGVITEAHRPEPLAENRIAIDRTLQEGDTIRIGRVELDVLETPGHSDCSLSFRQTDAGVLVVSDATGYYLPEQNEWWPNYFTGYGVYLDSMRRLAELDAEVLCLSHNAAIQGGDAVKAYFEAAIAATEQYHRRIIEQTRAGKPAREIAEQLGSRIYEKKPLLPLDFFQKNCALLVKISLQHEGIE
ncbi:MAG: MBL fold metallo-hydrolase [Pirellulales bacterium]|nr:MBL fold metallo-hydrolase [Pirellulales bacterium]